MQEENKNKKSEAALREEKILEFWRENKIFEKSVKQREGSKEFVFYEGPPTANGKPGIHHVEARSFKDAIPRYRTMCGFHVRRKGGWDTHGLPVELQVEKKLGLNSKKAIEEYGVAKFNQECKESVWDYLDVWNKFTKRIGFWVDQENPYVTYENSYIESLWSVVKRVDEQKLLYKDYKVVPWCPRCGTALSSHELAQGYEDVKDLSLYVKFKIVGFDKAYFLAWTTTLWTLPGNVGLAVGKDIEYVEIKRGEEILVLAKDRLSIIDGEYEIIATHKGSEMVGMQYEPLFSYLSDTILDAEKTKLQNAFKVYVADFVNVTDGTGIVHTAVMYGQDDFVIAFEID
jgi:isoleucyl-tRNA synthetase